MKERLLELVEALRAAGLAPSTAELLDALAAVTVAGIERPALREALAATLVKDHADRPLFDELFERFFAVADPSGAKPRQRRQGGEGSGRGGEGEALGRRMEPRQDGRAARRDSPERQPTQQTRREAQQRQRLLRRRAVLARPFRDMSPLEVEEAGQLVEELGRRLRARSSRRLRATSRGRIDIRRTIRRAVSRGGVPIELLFRRPRPGKTDLVALVDLSFSTATAAEFLLALLAPARSAFRRVTVFGYVESVVEISYENGHVVPHEPLDLNARSDFGQVLKELQRRADLLFGRNTVLLVLGDARNNRRPPHTPILRLLRARARAVIWVNPEPVERWNTGDSVIAAYSRHSDATLAAWNLASLTRAVERLTDLAL